MEQFINSLITTAIGMSVVFSSLIVIILFILLVNKIISLFTKKSPKIEVKDEINIVDDTASVEDRRRIVAAITAALTASVYSDTNTRFIVKKIKKI